jgi:hypothetical protein
MEDPVADAILNQYFRRLEQALIGVPADRRTQIVEDLRAHVAECLEAEPDHSDATVLAILDRLGDPDEIAREALADNSEEATSGSPDGPERTTASFGPAAVLRSRPWLTSGALLVLAAAVVLVLVSVTGSRTVDPPVTATAPANARVNFVASHAPPGTNQNGWLPARYVSGGGGIDNSECGPQTMSGSESTSALETGATKVASGTVNGHSWEVWSKTGQTGANGLENGGVVIDGVAHGLCPGFPNPAEMEMLEPSAGGNGIAYGVVGYAGTAKVKIYQSTAETFDTGKLLASTTAQKVNGVGFFITPIAESACDVPSTELNTASANYATEHSLGFSTNHCVNGQLVPINDSAGTWQLSTAGFPDKFQSGNGGGGGGGMSLGLTSGGWLPAADVSGGGGIDNSECGPQTLSGSETASTLEAGASKVASGTVGGDTWSVWSKNGQTGANGLENGGVVIDGVAHGLCPGFPNPAEMEMLEPSGGGDGVVYGVIGYPGPAKVNIYRSAGESFSTEKLLGTTTAQKVNGVGFFITTLSQSGCASSSLELNTASSDYATEHSLGFNTNRCANGQLVPIDDSAGIWQLPTKDFPDKFQSLSGGGGRISTPTLANTTPTLDKNGWLPASDVSGGGGIDNSECGPQTVSGSEPASALEAAATKVASGSVAGHSWSVWSKNGQTGANGIENGGIVVDGTAHGLCPGFPNPAEMEMLEPSGGGNGLAYGVVGYAGAAKVDVYRGTAETFDTGTLLASTTAQKVGGVGFFIAPLSEPACDVSAVELNTASANYASEHNLGFSTNHCTNGNLVPISWSQGTWQLPTTEFPDKFQSGGGGGRLIGGGGLLSRTGPDFSSCSPRTDPASSGPVTASIAGASQVASGTIEGQSWSLWSKDGVNGSAALEDAGVILDGNAYSICPGTPNPAEFELIDPQNGGDGIVIGVSGYNGGANVKLSEGTSHSFTPGTLLYSGRTISADGTGFFIAELPKSACNYGWLNLNVKAAKGRSQHVLGFGLCRAGKLSPITGGQGEWSASR